MKKNNFLKSLLVLLPSMFAPALYAAGTLASLGSTDAPMQIREHHVNVVIESGFAKTEVLQTFYNPNPTNLEAVYRVPIPEHGALSELTIIAGEDRLDGEVLAKDKANQVYEEERAQGNDSAIANKKEFETFEFRVSPVRARSETKMRYVYYQPLKVDTGIVRYHYPVEDGGTDDGTKQFWSLNQKVENSLSANVRVRTSFPIAELRMPGFEQAAKIDKVTESEYTVALDIQGASLDRDLVLYYRLEEELPGRLELLTHKPEANKPGTFMLIATPGVDLGAITAGADYTFVLDTSGSMAGKLNTLARGVAQALGALKPQDRFRVITFADSAHDLTGWRAASPEEVRTAIAKVEALSPNGGTNLYSGIELALAKLDADRVSSIVLVTDGVTNTGVIDPKEFAKLMSQYDVRVFGFLMGNSSNWPLMRTIADASGGFYASVSNADDIVGQIMLARSKILSEALHDAVLSIDGIQTSETSEGVLGKIYRGEQIVFFGRYKQGGDANIKLATKLSGEDKTYQVNVHFPDQSTQYPEVERLFALDRVERIGRQMSIGLLPESEGKKMIEELGVQYQLVTDETAMVVLHDQRFAKHGIERLNRQRAATESQAQASRYSQPVTSNRVDNSPPMFPSRSHSLFNGGGAIDPMALVIIALFFCCAAYSLIKGDARRAR